MNSHQQSFFFIDKYLIVSIFFSTFLLTLPLDQSHIFSQQPSVYMLGRCRDEVWEYET